MTPQSSGRPPVTITVTLQLTRVSHSHMPTRAEAWDMAEDCIDLDWVDFDGDYNYKAQIAAVEVKG